MAVLYLLRLLLLWSFFLQHPTSRLHRIVTCDLASSSTCHVKTMKQYAMPSKPSEKIRQIHVKRQTRCFFFWDVFWDFFAASTASKSCAVLVRPCTAEVKSTARQREDTTQKQKEKKTNCANKVRMKLKNETRKNTKAQQRRTKR